MEDMVLVGYAVAGDGKFGKKEREMVPAHDGEKRYWENRGYETYPVYMTKQDFEESLN